MERTGQEVANPVPMARSTTAPAAQRAAGLRCVIGQLRGRMMPTTASSAPTAVMMIESAESGAPVRGMPPRTSARPDGIKPRHIKTAMTRTAMAQPRSVAEVSR